MRTAQPTYRLTTVIGVLIMQAGIQYTFNADSPVWILGVFSMWIVLVLAAEGIESLRGAR